MVVTNSQATGRSPKEIELVLSWLDRRSHAHRMFQNAPGLTLMRPIYRRRMNLHPSNSGRKTKFRGGLVDLVVPSPSWPIGRRSLLIIIVVIIHMSMTVIIAMMVVSGTTASEPWNKSRNQQYWHKGRGAYSQCYNSYEHQSGHLHLPSRKTFNKWFIGVFSLIRW